MSRLVLEDCVQALAEQGVGVVLVEQRAQAALKISQWGYVLVGGRLAIEGAASELLERDDLARVFLGAQDS
jgi:branched-chain amino acid transport system ATP-binding protein